MTAPVSIVMGSDSDLPVMRDAQQVLAELGVASDIAIVSAHRTPRRMFEFAQHAEENGVSVIIAGAGGAAHLPGMIASLTPLPVIGVPISATKMEGMDALLSIVQMPAGIPVATVAIDNARNAGLLAAQILGVADAQVRAAIRAFRGEMTAAVERKAQALADVTLTPSQSHQPHR
jgi:5-(carboxyamino)imidazole ribonucleotide mutase